MYNHACVMARARRWGRRAGGDSSIDAAERRAWRRAGFLRGEYRGRTEWIDAAVGRLGEKVYVTIDLDVFDPAIMPSTGTPEPGGMFWYEVLGFLKAVAMRREIVGFDVVELCPNAANKGPDFLAAKLVYKLLSYRFELRK